MTNENNVVEPHQTEAYLDAIERFRKNPTGTYKNKYTPLKTISNKNNRGGNARYKIDDVKKWLENPANSQKQLRDFSNFLYNSSYLYKWFISILSNMPTWYWVMSMDTFSNNKGKDKIEKLYRQGAKTAHLKYSARDLTNAFVTSIKEDWFYGYEVESDDSYFILKLDPNFCKVSAIFDDGVRGFKFDFSYFDDKTDNKSGKNPSNIVDTYPDEFKKGYAKYKRTGERWIQLDPLNTICWKLNDDLDYGIPYFSTIFDALNDVGFYKELNKERAEMDNFLLLHQLIPVDEDKVDKFAINLDLAQDFDAVAQDGLPEWASVVTTPMKVTAIKTERSATDKNNAKDALENAYAGSGLPMQLANPTTSAALALAIKANEQIVYRFYRQVEKTVNFKMKYKYLNAKFTTRILDITQFNKTDRIKELLEGAQSGLVPPEHVASAYGSNPYEMLNNLDLEDNILNIVDRLKPIKTSHTLTGDEKAGASKKTDDKISDSTERTRDTDANQNRTV